MPPAGATWVVIAKAPVPGRVKTRLCPPCSHEQAAQLARAALEDTLDAVVATPAAAHVIALEGVAPPWLPGRFHVVAQQGDGLDERLGAVFAAAQGPTLIIGMDTPQVDATLLGEATARLADDDVDAVLGPAEDGGYWVIGLARPDPAAVLGVPMSEPHTLEAQRARLSELGLRVHELATLRDVDEIEDALAVATLAPTSRFATVLGDLGLGDLGSGAQAPPSGSADTTTGSPGATSPGLTTST